MPSKRIVNGKWNGKWVARVTVNGKSAYNGVNHPTKTAAREAENAKRAEMRTQRARVETVRSFADRWVRDYPRPANSTNSTNKYAIKRVAAKFGEVPLHELDRADAKAWARTVSASAVRAARAMFSDAIDDRLCSENPFANLRLEQSRGRKDIEVISDAQLDTLARLCVEEDPRHGPILAAYLRFAAFTCMRPGEINALCWDDIDFENGEIRVSKNIEAPTGFVKWPKNEHHKDGGPRTIILPPPARDALRTVPRSLDPVMIRDLRHNDPREFPFYLIFRGKHGGKLTEPKMGGYWKPVRAAFRIKHPESRMKDIYELRHKGATDLLERGVMHADVAVQMGHTDGGGLVMSTYGHPSEKLARERLKRAWQEPVRLAEARDAKEQAG